MSFDINTILRGFVLYILEKNIEGLTEEEIEKEIDIFLKKILEVIDL